MKTGIDCPEEISEPKYGEFVERWEPDEDAPTGGAIVWLFPALFIGLGLLLWWVW